MNSFNREQAEREAKYSRQGSSDSSSFPSLLIYIEYLLLKVTVMDDLLPRWLLMRVKVAAKIGVTL